MEIKKYPLLLLIVLLSLGKVSAQSGSECCGNGICDKGETIMTCCEDCFTTGCDNPAGTAFEYDPQLSAMGSNPNSYDYPDAKNNGQCYTIPVTCMPAGTFDVCFTYRNYPAGLKPKFAMFAVPCSDQQCIAQGYVGFENGVSSTTRTMCNCNFSTGISVRNNNCVVSTSFNVGCSYGVSFNNVTVYDQNCNKQGNLIGACMEPDSVYVICITVTIPTTLVNCDSMTFCPIIRSVPRSCDVQFNVLMDTTREEICKGIVTGGTASISPADSCNGPYNFIWSTGSTDVQITGLTAGTYTVTATNGLGCIVVDTVTVTQYTCPNDDFEVWFPNAFTPERNTFPENKRARVRGQGIADIELRIFDRWGELVYVAKDVTEAMENGWDGTKKGNPAGIDSYAYYIKAMSEAGAEVFLKGSIVLLR